jgi:hypothetical protein
MALSLIVFKTSLLTCCSTFCLPTHKFVSDHLQISSLYDVLSVSVRCRGTNRVQSRYSDEQIVGRDLPWSHLSAGTLQYPAQTDAHITHGSSLLCLSGPQEILQDLAKIDGRSRNASIPNRPETPPPRTLRLCGPQTDPSPTSLAEIESD